MGWFSNRSGEDVSSPENIHQHPDWTDKKISQAQQESGLTDATKLSSYMQGHGQMVCESDVERFLKR